MRARADDGLPDPTWIAAGTATAGLTWIWLVLSTPARPGAASAAAGSLIALLAVLGSTLAARWGLRRGPDAFLHVLFLGVPARMAFIGAGVGLASRLAGLRLAPFAIALLTVYLAAELWLTLAQKSSLAAARRDGPLAPHPEEV